jgi:hypothetical protein
MLLPAVSCRRDDVSPEEARDALKQDVSFTASMDGYQVKATDISFQDGDAVGIYGLEPIDAVNVKATVQGEALVPVSPIRWELVRSAVFIAYYPYDAAYGDEPQMSFSVKADQRNYDAYLASDLRGAVAQGRNGETVALPFRHMLSKLTILARCEDSAEEVTGVTIGGVSTKVQANIPEMSVVTAGSSTNIMAGKAVAGNGNEGYVAILVPQTLKGLPLSVTTSKGQSLVFHPAEPLTFESGYAYTTSMLTVPKKEKPEGKPLTFTVSITDWGDGGSMDFHRGKTN